MRRQSKFLREYGIWVKLGLVCLFFISLGGLNIITFSKEVSSQSNLPNHNTKLEDWTRPPTYEGPEFEAWKARKESAQKEIDSILSEAQAKGENYSIYNYFQDFDKLMELEDKYNFLLTVPYLNPIEELLRLRDAKGIWSKANKNITPEQQQHIEKVQDRIFMRRGEGPRNKAELISGWQILSAITSWFWPKYLLLTLFWFLIYLIRFEEKDEAIRRFQRHHHELGRFINDEEPFPGQLSLKDELIICPWRLLSRVLLWPFYCFAYPHFENTAEGIRYVRAEARLLQGKPFGYQLSPAEDAWLRRQARQPVKEFEKTLKQLSDFEVPQLVRKSLLTAYMSLLFGILLQPAIVLAAAHSNKAAQHFFGNQVQLVQMQQVNQHQLDGPSPPQQQHPDFQAVLPSPVAVQPILQVLYKVAIEFWLRLPLLVFDIDHVPLNSLV